MNKDIVISNFDVMEYTKQRFKKSCKKINSINSLLYKGEYKEYIKALQKYYKTYGVVKNKIDKKDSWHKQIRDGFAKDIRLARLLNKT